MKSNEPISVHMVGSEWFASRPGGLNRYFSSLYTALSDREDISTSAIAFGAADPTDPEAHSWPTPARNSTFARARAARERPNEVSPTILDRHFCLYGPSAKDYSVRPRHVIHFQGPWAAESVMAGAGAVSARLKHLVEEARYRTGDHFVVLSESFKSVLMADYHVPEDRITRIPPGVDLREFTFESMSAASRPIVLCVRRLERRMGIQVLIRAWQDVHERFPDAELHIVGSGTFENQLRDQAARQGSTGDSIIFRNRLSDEDLRQAYRDATLTVVPSIALEGFGLIALESLAVGRAPIVTNCGGLPDAVTGLDSSLVVPVGDADHLAERIIEGMNGRLPSPAACRAHAETFSWGIAAGKHVDLYRSLI